MLASVAPTGPRPTIATSWPSDEVALWFIGSRDAGDGRSHAIVGKVRRERNTAFPWTFARHPGRPPLTNRTGGLNPERGAVAPGWRAVRHDQTWKPLSQSRLTTCSGSRANFRTGEAP